MENRRLQTSRHFSANFGRETVDFVRRSSQFKRYLYFRSAQAAPKPTTTPRSTAWPEFTASRGISHYWPLGSRQRCLIAIRPRTNPIELITTGEGKWTAFTSLLPPS